MEFMSIFAHGLKNIILSHEYDYKNPCRRNFAVSGSGN